MMIFDAVCESIKTEWPEYDKVIDSYTKFENSIENALKKESGLSPAIVNHGKAFINELNSFQNMPEVEKENLQELIKHVKKTGRKIINLL